MSASSLCVQAAVDSLPDELRSRMSNVAIVIDDDAPADSPLLGLYQGIPLTRRSTPLRDQRRATHRARPLLILVN